MEYFIFVMLVLSVQAPTIQGSPITLQSPKLIELPVGGVFRLNCSASSTYLIEFKEIGQDWTIEDRIAYEGAREQDGNPRVRYSQEGCLDNNPPDIACIKTLEMDIVESLHGKSFQCRARTREMNPVMYYSEGSYLRVRQHITVTPSHVLTEMPSTSVEHSTTTTTQTTLIEASPTGVPSVASPTQTSDVMCQCNGSVSTKRPLFLSLVSAAVVLFICYILT